MEKVIPIRNVFNLTNREMEILRAIASCESVQTIARNLSMDKCTVKLHLTDISRKIGVRDRLDLFLLATYISFAKSEKVDTTLEA
jgi:DNA-binding NarL/FixJ family response regulator